ncbi:MAG: hypothetical protein GY854_14300 [Deltaproteobacteria bacterium]|nr:hypothetical protein [Deltaproteobacteria bacterium]
MDSGTTGLAEEVAQALVGDVDPENVEAFNFASGILPAFRLIRALFSMNELDSCLKLMVLHELSRTSGRFTIERIRSCAAFLDPGRVDGIVRSLREGEWLNLRAVDNTYTMSPLGLTLIAVLHAADIGGLSPTNVLARAAQNAAFGAKLEGAGGVTGYLLDQLLVMLEDQVEEARQVLRQGRPFKMIAWSRRHHRRQLDIIRQVLASLTEHMEESSREFGKIVRLHEAMQQVIAQLSGIHERLMDWNIERLHTSEAGYSIPELSEAVLGVEDSKTLLTLLDDGVLFVPHLPPTLTTGEIQERFEAARRKLPSQKEQYVYSLPTEQEVADFSAAEVDPAAALRTRLTALLTGRDQEEGPLELDDWILGDSFPRATFELGNLCRLERGRGVIQLDDESLATMKHSLDYSRDIPPEEVLGHLEQSGALRRVREAQCSRVTLSTAKDTKEKGSRDHG